MTLNPFNSIFGDYMSEFSADFDLINCDKENKVYYPVEKTEVDEMDCDF